MSDLKVRTEELRGTAAALRSTMAGPAGFPARQGVNARRAEAVGEAAAVAAAIGFLHRWSGPIGRLASDAERVAGLLDAAAQTFEKVEAGLTAAAGGVAAPIGAGSGPRCGATGAPAGAVPPRPSGADVDLAGLAAAGSGGAAPVHLEWARRPQDVVPGEPEIVHALARELAGYTEEFELAAGRLRRLGTGDWRGLAASAVAAELADLPGRCSAVVLALDDAAVALGRHARVLVAAQDLAVRALRAWEALTPAERALGADPVTGAAANGRSVADVRVQAATARAAAHASARALADALDAAAARAPKGPGFLSRLLGGVGHAIGEFAGAAGESVAGLAEFAYGLTLEAVVDPADFLHNLDALLAGLLDGVLHPDQLARAVLDVDTWRDDPARALGHLAPDLLAALATAGAGTAARGVQTARAARREDDAARAIADDLSVIPRSPRVAWRGEGGLTLRARESAAAERFLARAAANESAITERVVQLAHRCGGELVGLDSRLKTPDSLKRKLAEQVKNSPFDGSAVPVLRDLHDVLRYTVQFDEHAYAKKAQHAMDEFLADGYKPIKVRNAWGENGYQGLNTSWRDPENGQRFEVQFHTEASFKANKDTRPWFEEQRLSSTPRPRVEELQARQDAVFAKVAVPESSRKLVGADAAAVSRADAMRGVLIGHVGVSVARLSSGCDGGVGE